MKFFILFIISQSVFALVYGDKMQGKILKAYDQNYLVLNRGIEDGIFKGEHVKITNEQGYVSRAICVKPRMLLSHCKVYRVVNPELLSFDSEYTISSIKQSEIPDDLKFLKDINYEDRFNDYTDEDVNKLVEVQNQRIANFDLINDFKDDRIKPRDDATKTQASLNKNFDPKKLKDDFKAINIKLFASPVTLQSQGNGFSSNIGMILKNDGSKYNLTLAVNSRKNKIVNQYNNTSITQSTTNMGVDFELKDFSDNMSTYSFISINNESFDNIQTPMNSNKIGVIGIKYYISQSDDFKSNISYIPFFEKTTLDSNKQNKEITDNFVRHRIKYSAKKEVSDSLSLGLGIDFQPEFTFKEITSFINFNLDMKLSKNSFFSYEIDFISNTLIQEHYNLKNTNLINSLNFNYNFNL